MFNLKKKKRSSTQTIIMGKKISSRRSRSIYMYINVFSFKNVYITIFFKIIMSVRNAVGS